MVLSYARPDRTSPIRDRRGVWPFSSGWGAIRDGRSGRLGRTFAWLHPAALVTHTPNHRTTAPTPSRAGQPSVFKLGLNLAGVPKDSCLCCLLYPPYPRPASASPLPTQNAGTLTFFFFKGKRMSIVPTLKEEMDTGKCHSARAPPDHTAALVLLRPGAPGDKDSQEGATHAVDLGVPFPGPCGAFWSSAPFPPPLTPTHLRAQRLWPRPCGPARRRAAPAL